jgi:peptidoglycan/xylan/chitin deacetylase (PgdA/CDA1 family)
VRRFLLPLALAIALVLGATSVAQARIHPRSCNIVTVGKYQAQAVRAVNITCSVASRRLHTWLRHGAKSLPHDRDHWHAKHLRGSIWEVLYGRKPGPSVRFALMLVQPLTINIASPASNASYTWGQAGTAQFSCSGSVAVATCTASVGSAKLANGAALPTSGAPGPGTRTLTVTAIDSSRGETTKSVTYVVQPAGYYAIELHNGPNPTFTQPTLNALASVHAKANFFLVGEYAKQFPALAKEEVRDGMLVGSKTQKLVDVGPPDGVNPVPVAPDTPSLEIRNAATSIAAATGVTPTLFMPPFGDYDASTQALVTSLTGETLCAFTVDSRDARSPTPSTATIVANAEAVNAGGMVAMHDTVQNTVAAIPRIVTDLRNNEGLEPGMMYANPALSVPGPYVALPPFHCGVKAWPAS